MIKLSKRHEDNYGNFPSHNSIVRALHFSLLWDYSFVPPAFGQRRRHNWQLWHCCYGIRDFCRPHFVRGRAEATAASPSRLVLRCYGIQVLRCPRLDRAELLEGISRRKQRSSLLFLSMLLCGEDNRDGEEEGGKN